MHAVSENNCSSCRHLSWGKIFLFDDRTPGGKSENLPLSQHELSTGEERSTELLVSCGLLSVIRANLTVPEEKVEGRLFRQVLPRASSGRLGKTLWRATSVYQHHMVGALLGDVELLHDTQSEVSCGTRIASNVGPRRDKKQKKKQKQNQFVDAIGTGKTLKYIDKAVIPGMQRCVRTTRAFRRQSWTEKTNLLNDDSKPVRFQSGC